MSKYTHMHIVSLEGKFKPGTIGNELEYLYETKMPEPVDLEHLFIQEDTYPKKTIKYIKIFQAFADPEESDPDEVLRDANLYDSKDPRSCTKRKRE